MIPRIWEGEACVIIAGGPSLAGFNFQRLAGFNVIAINSAYLDCPFAQVLWWSDARFWRKHRDGLIRHGARYKATCEANYAAGELTSDIHVYGFKKIDGFDENPAFIRTGNNSSYAALHLCAHLGAKTVLLLGVDMRHGDHGETHYHGGHGLPHHERTLTQLMVPHFSTLNLPLEVRGIRVINGSPRSALSVWPRCTIDEGLALIGKASAEPQPLQLAGSI